MIRMDDRYTEGELRVAKSVDLYSGCQLGYTVKACWKVLHF